MKYISIIEQATKEAIRAFVEKRNLTEYITEDYRHPQEDYLAVSNQPPVFVVSDGVTLNFKKLIEDKIKYPDPSPAGQVAKIFCEAVIKNASDKYSDISAKKAVEIFKEANEEVKTYNKGVGLSDISGNITGYYSATGSFVVIKGAIAYWVSICDSFVAHFDKNMNLKFMSSGVCQPYAVINGEDRMADHLEKGIFELEEGDRIFAFNDGFEHSAINPSFLNLFREWGDNLKEQVAEFSNKMNFEDPEKYGHERSIIAILIQ